VRCADCTAGSKLILVTPDVRVGFALCDLGDSAVF
jgi:hypothetical protein